jgi:hypothetical protein
MPAASHGAPRLMPASAVARHAADAFYATLTCDAAVDAVYFRATMPLRDQKPLPLRLFQRAP